MKKDYQKLEMELVLFEVYDVLTSSYDQDIDDPYNC